MAYNFFRKKSLTAIRQESLDNKLEKNLSALDLVLLGLGGIIGSGIFVITGFAAARYAGPAVLVSFMLGGAICILIALAYSELASLIPTSGGAYTYAFVTLGEFFGFMLGWNTIVGYSFGAATVAAGWSGYVAALLENFNIYLPHMFLKPPSDGGIVNLPAVFIVLFLTFLSIRGTKLIAKFNGVLVFAKLAAILGFVVLALPHCDLENWKVFSPYGFSGIITGTGFVFMAYSGFDTIATAAEESKNPQRDLPIGIIGSLLIATMLYVVVSGALTAVAHYSLLDNPKPIAQSLFDKGVLFGSKIVAVGAIAGLTTVILANLFGQARILMSMSRDKLLPSWMEYIHPRFGTPSKGIAMSGVIIALIAGWFPAALLGQVVSLCSLLMYMVVGLCAMLARKQYPLEKRGFVCPAIFWVSGIAIVCSFVLFVKLLSHSWETFTLATLCGVAAYFLFCSSKVEKKASLRSEV